MLAALVSLAVALATTLTTGLAALATHHLVLASNSHVITAGVLAVLARIATVATSIGHCIFRPVIFFTQVGRTHSFSRLKEVPDLQPCAVSHWLLKQNDPHRK